MNSKAPRCIKAPLRQRLTLLQCTGCEATLDTTPFALERDETSNYTRNHEDFWLKPYTPKTRTPQTLQIQPEKHGKPKPKPVKPETQHPSLRPKKSRKGPC